MPELDDFFHDPDFFINRLRYAEGEVEFLRVDRNRLADEVFLNDHPGRVSGIWANRFKVSLEDLLVYVGAKDLPKPSGVIFQTAMCGSTLLANCLDVPGRNLSLKEPQVLMDLANARRFGETKHLSEQEWDELVRVVLGLLCKTRKGESVLLKNSNRTNILAADISRVFPETKILLLYSSMQPFMLSMLKRGQPSWEYCRNLLKMQFVDAGINKVEPLWGAIEYTDLQIAPLVWHMQFDRLADFQHNTPSEHVKSLDCEVFFSKPRDTLRRVFNFFEVELSDVELTGVVESKVLGAHSKNTNKPFGPQARKVEQAEAMKKYSGEMEFVEAFSKKMRPDVGLSRPLTNPI